MDKSVILKTERLVLRPFMIKDVDDVFEYTRDPEWARYSVGVPPVPYSRKTVEELVTMFSEPPDEQGLLQMFAITLGGKVIGEMALNQWEEHRRNERVELAYSLALPYWNKGLTTEAARAVVDWAFKTLSFHRMCAWCDPDNIGSWRVLEKIGMKREGRLRGHTLWNGKFRDQLWYGILREEWENGR